MSFKVPEGDLLFEFDERWRPVMSWDRHAAYQSGIKEVDRGKAVDLIGVFDNTRVFFIEVKDYRVHARTKTESPWAEFELKVRNTVAGLVGSGRREEYASVCAPFLKALLHPRDLKLVFWIEQPPLSTHSDTLRKRRKVRAGIAMRRANIYMKWLDARAITVSQDDEYEQIVPGLKVKNLARRRRELAETIVKALHGRGIPVGPDSLRRISEHTEIEELEAWLDQTDTVSTAEELFDDHR